VGRGLTLSLTAHIVYLTCILAAGGRWPTVSSSISLPLREEDVVAWLYNEQHSAVSPIAIISMRYDMKPYHATNGN